MFTKGPLARVTINMVIVTLLVCISILLFAYESVRRDNIQVEHMMADVPALIEIYNLINDYPKFTKVDYSQDGHLTLLDSNDEELVKLTVSSDAQIEALINLDEIYRDDYGVIFSYGSNYLSTVPRVVFSGKSMEDLKNKKSDNETVTKVTNGVFMIVYRFDYERFFSPEEILNQAGQFADVFYTGAKEFLINEQQT